MTVITPSQRTAPHRAVLWSWAPIAAAKLPRTSRTPPVEIHAGTARHSIRQASTTAIVTISTSSVPVPEN